MCSYISSAIIGTWKRAAMSSISRRCWRVNTEPQGFDGLLITIAAVRSSICASRSSRSICQPSSGYKKMVDWKFFFLSKLFSSNFHGSLANNKLYIEQKLPEDCKTWLRPRDPQRESCRSKNLAWVSICFDPLSPELLCRDPERTNIHCRV